VTGYQAWRGDVEDFGFCGRASLAWDEAEVFPERWALFVDHIGEYCSWVPGGVVWFS
jgi:hypothetical protein